jgi:hypothetical protein
MYWKPSRTPTMPINKEETCFYTILLRINDDSLRIPNTTYYIK